MKQNREVGLSNREHESEEIFNRLQRLAEQVTGTPGGTDLRILARGAHLLAKVAYVDVDQS